MNKITRRIASGIIIMSTVLSINTIIPSYADMPKQYTIKFNSNDGNGVILKLKKTKNVNVVMPDTKVSHTGFEFMGWAKDKKSTFPDYPADMGWFEEDIDITLYAVWRTADKAGEVDYSKPLRKISGKSLKKKVGKSFKIKSKTIGEGKCKFKYKSLNSKVVKITSSGKAKALKKGKAVIKITAPEDGLYTKTTKKITIKVK